MTDKSKKQVKHQKQLKHEKNNHEKKHHCHKEIPKKDLGKLYGGVDISPDCEQLV